MAPVLMPNTLSSDGDQAGAGHRIEVTSKISEVITSLPSTVMLGVYT